MHRDKPEYDKVASDYQKVFPVCTGINRDEELADVIKLSVPCMHRDKPLVFIMCCHDHLCSLYAQG